MAKDLIMICLDVSPSMNNDPLGSGDTPFQMSVRVATQLIQTKIFAGGKDIIGLMAFGTENTDNNLASSGGGYENISVLYPPACPTVELLNSLVSLKPGETSADFIDAIVVAMDMLIAATGDVKKVGEKKIYLLTDAGSGYNDNQVEIICAGFKEKGIELIVIGPDIDDGGDDDGDGGGGGSDDNGLGDGGGPGPSHGRPRPSSAWRKRTPQQVAGEAMLGRLIHEVEGTSYSFHEALQASTFIRKNAKKQTARFVGHLEIGSQLKIPCKIFTKVMVERPSTWKKLSAVSQASASDGNMALKMQRTYHRNDEDETEVEKEDVAKGYRYGKSLVPMSEENQAAMKFKADRCLSVLGFTKDTNIKQHQFIGTSVQVLVATPGDENGARALSGIIHALFETEMMGVARCVYRKDSQPKLVALIPHIKAQSECLLVMQLPYMEDVRQFVFGSLPGERKAAKPSEEQLAAVDDLITNMDLMKADRDENRQECKALQPKKICNPVIQRMFQCIGHRALHPDQPLPDIDPVILSVLQPNPTLLTSCNQDMQKVKELFPLEKVEKKTKNEGAAAEVWKKTSDLDLEGPPQPKKHHGDSGTDDVDFSMASLARGAITKVGTLDPVADYKTLLGKGDFIEASNQLKKVAMDFVKESFGDSHYEKAIECVRALRDESIKQDKAEVFNSFLMNLKDEFLGTRYFPFWEGKVMGEGVTLISSSESSSSSISSEQAAQFIQAGIPDSGTGGPGTADEKDLEDPDDLLEMM